MKKKITILFLVSVMFLIAYTSKASFNVSASSDNFEVGDTLPDDYVFTTMDQDGNIVEYDTSELEKKTEEENIQQQLLLDTLNGVLGVGGTRSISEGIVNFKTKANSSLNTTYTVDGSGVQGYVNGYYGADAAFLGYSDDNTKVKFMISGVVGWVNASEVQVLDFSSAKSYSCYQVDNGILNHYLANDLNSSYCFAAVEVGAKQSYMSEGVEYFSYDGHYFYTSYETMIKDYKAGNRNNSINANNPYYNYYQYLSHRTQTSFSASNFNAYTNTNTGNNTSSKMYNLGSAYIDNQNLYGSNAALMYGVSANESAWGLSSIALNKNNLFGHGATDSNPYYGANGYSSPAYSVLYHAKVFISEGYLDTKDASGRYYGSHLGNKASGINVKYASDPYWGEKAAAISWKLNRTYSSNKDSSKYTIAIKPSGSNLNIRKEASTSSTSLYQTGTATDYPFIVLEAVNGEVVNGSSVWYKIQSDTTLNSNRTALTQDNGAYDFNNYYGYVHSSYVDIVCNGSNIDSGDNSFILGDVNGDKKVGSADYLIIKDYIMGKTTLSANQIKAADVTKDGKVGSADYLKIKDYIMGKISSL